MDVVTQAHAVDAFAGMRDDLDRLSAAMYFLELTDRFTVEHAEADAIYAHLHAALVRLARGDGQQVVTRIFELARSMPPASVRSSRLSRLRRPVDASDAARGHRWRVASTAPTARDAGRGAPIDPTVLRVLRAYQRNRTRRRGASASRMTSPRASRG
jgi:hypothetical protein